MSYSRLNDPPPTNIPMMKLPSKWRSQPQNKSPPISSARRKRLIFSYAPDWVITILLAAFFFSLDKVHGFRRDFSLEDSSISHPFAVHERVPNVALYFICFVAPLLIMPIINFFTVRSWWDLHNSTLGLILGLALTGSLTQLVKITVGRPRPDLLDRCQPPPGSADPTFGLTTSDICTNVDFGILNDGFRSFFSGHSSLSFAGMGFLSFYLAGKLHLFDERGHASKAWLALTPFLVAALVAISRTMDYRHHWQDVTVGTIVGIVFSLFAYRQYYPSLSSPLSHRPYSPRIARQDAEALPTHTTNNSISAPVGNSHSANNSVYDMGRPYGSTAYNGASSQPVDQAAHNASANAIQHTFSEDSYLEGTVPRPGPGSLEDVWKDGESDGPRIEHANPRERNTAYQGYQTPPLPRTGATGGQV